MIKFSDQKSRCLLALIGTLAVIHLIANSLLVTAILLVAWYFLFRPWVKNDIIVFAIASLFFLVQNYLVLKEGGFAFAHQDILLQPYYEPFMWGFYYLNIKRFFSEPETTVNVGIKALIGLAITGISNEFFRRCSCSRY